MRDAPVVLTGDTVEFAIAGADLTMTGVVLGTTLMPFYGYSTFSVWTDAYGGRAMMLPIMPRGGRSRWRLLHRPPTLELARERMLIARARYEKQMEEVRRHGS